MRRTSLFVLALAVSLATSARAQRLWLPPDATRNIGIDIAKGFYKSTDFGVNVGFASFAVTAQGRFPVNDKLAVTVAVPLARISQTSVGYTPIGQNATQTQTALGNPWLGVEVAARPGLIIEAGIRPGIASDEKEAALGLGIVNDFDRFEAWLPKVSSGRVMAHIGRVPDQGGFVTGIFGGTVAIPGGSVGGTTQLYANYGMRAGFHESGILGTVTLTGRLNLSESGASLGDRTLHQLAFNVEGTHGGFRPNASIRMFLKQELRAQVSAIVTVGGSFEY